MRVSFEVLIILALIGVNGLFSMSELALVSARRARLMVLERRGIKGASIARTLAADPQRFLPTVQVGVTLVSVLLGVFSGASIGAYIQAGFRTLGASPELAATVALVIVVVATTYLTLVLGELVPKQIALRRPEATAARIARPIAWTARIMGPVVWLLGHSSALVLRALGLSRAVRQTVTEEELRALLAEGTQAGVLEAEERDIIERVLRLADKPVRAIMTPRTEVAWIDRTDRRPEIVATLRAAPHSRFVVCEGSVDNVVGVVQAKDLLDSILERGDLSMAAALRQPIVVPDTVSALDALERLKADPIGIALVMDEYGSFEGVVTAADLLNAIVGDPTDVEPTKGPPGAKLSLVTLDVDGLMPVDELKSRLELPELPAAGTYHTVGGLLLALLQRVPRIGDRIVFAGWRFEVLQMDGRRVDKVRVSKEPAPAVP
jgi:putative hemolysin